MMRAAVGSWVLILVLSALLVSSGLAGPGVPGAAVRQPPPTPPPIGSCVADLRSGQVVDCSQEHFGEVILSWTGTRLTGADEPLPDGAVASDDHDACWRAVEDWIGLAEPVEYSDGIRWFRSTLSLETQVATGPVRRVIEDWSWSACVVRPADTSGTAIPWRGSVRGAGLDPFRPMADAWRTCQRGDELWVWVPCTQPHTAEPVGGAEISLPQAELERLAAEQLLAQEQQVLDDQDATFWPAVAPKVNHPVAEQECRTLAEDLLGAPLSTHDGELTAAITWSPSYTWSSSEFDPAVTVPTGVWAECRIQVLGDRTLIGSLAGVGAGPLPYG